MSSSTLRDQLRPLAQSFVTEDGTGVRWLELAQTLFGAALITAGLGYSAIQNAVFSAAIGAINWLTGFQAGLLAKAAEFPLRVGTAAWQAATGAVTGFGLFGTILGVTLGLVFLYIWVFDYG